MIDGETVVLGVGSPLMGDDVLGFVYFECPDYPAYGSRQRDAEHNGEMAEPVEGAPLLREYGTKSHRGFESLSLRHLVFYIK